MHVRLLTLPVPSAAIVANGTANGINEAGMATFNLEASNFMDCTTIDGLVSVLQSTSSFDTLFTIHFSKKVLTIDRAVLLMALLGMKALAAATIANTAMIITCIFGFYAEDDVL